LKNERNFKMFDSWKVFFQYVYIDDIVKIVREETMGFA